MNVKKQFAEIYKLLEENSNRKVSTILPQLAALMSTKTAGGSDIGRTYLKDGDRTYAVYCYYHKKWELTDVAEYGSKLNTATGFNTMCKEGVSAWTKQQRAFKKQREALLMQLLANEIEKDEFDSALAIAEEERKAIEVRCDEHGYETAEEAKVAYEASKA